MRSIESGRAAQQRRRAQVRAVQEATFGLRAPTLVLAREEAYGLQGMLPIPYVFSAGMSSRSICRSSRL
jgi:hypothetical protein